MRNIVVFTFLSMDGVMQAPGGPEEDTEGGFKFGGWTFPYFDDYTGKIMEEEMKPPFELLLGRKTFDIFEGYWPKNADGWPGINEAKKYVVSSSRKTSGWENTEFINENVVEVIKKLKAQDGPNLQVWGSSKLIQTLMENDLVDMFKLKIFPVTLGNGKKLFAKGTIPAAFTLENDSQITPNGIVIANYKRAGELKIGSFE